MTDVESDYLNKQAEIMVGKTKHHTAVCLVLAGLCFLMFAIVIGVNIYVLF